MSLFSEIEQAVRDGRVAWEAFNPPMAPPYRLEDLSAPGRGKTAVQVMLEQQERERGSYWYQAALKYQGECREWRIACQDVSVARADIDISTPGRFRTAQLDAATNLLNRIDSLEKLLREVDMSTPEAWHAWLFRRDQLVPKK